MSDREDEPADLFDAMCRVDDLADWLRGSGYEHAAELLAEASDDLKGYIEIRLTPKAMP